jgi:pyruvate-formate lyase-activating enzyme
MTYSPYKLPRPKGVRALVGRIKAWLLKCVLANDYTFAKYIRHFPLRLFVFNTSLCNARCVFCPQSTHQDAKGVMKPEALATVLDEFTAKGGLRVSLCPNNGDPLTDPTFTDKLKAVSASGVRYIDLNTNGILLGRGDTAEALAAHADRVGISLPGLNREDYKRVYGVDRADAVLEGIEKLARIKRETGSSLRIELDLRIDRPFDDVMRDEGMQRLKPFLDDGTVVIDFGELYMEMETWSDQVSATQLTGMMTLRTDAPSRPRPCKRMMSDAALLLDGKIRVCACRYHKTNYDDLVTGDTTGQMLENVFMGEAHRALLQRTARGDWPKVCHGCTLYQPQDYPRRTWMSMAFDLLLAPLRR